MKSNSIKAFAFSIAVLGAANGFGQTQAVTDPVGFVSVTVPANSDAVLAVPMNRASVYKGVINSISGTTITVAGISPAWGNNQFVQALPTQINTYAVQFASGVKEGMIGKVTGNTANTFTISLESGDDLTGVKSETVDGAGLGDHIDIMPYWTPLSVLGSTVPVNTQILNFDLVGAGVNNAATGSYGFDGANWVNEDSFDFADHTPLYFGKAFILRNNNGSPLTASIVGAVPMSKHRILLRTLVGGGVDQDVRIGFSSPVPQTVGSIGLGFSEDDQLLVFNNASTGKNKAPSQTLFYTVADGWVDDGFTPVGTTFMIQPGQGYVFRKKGTASPTTIVWTSLQSYLQ